MSTLTRLRVTPAVVAATATAGALLGTGIVSIPCWFHALTGADCPFCGGSRALGALLHGDLAGALRFNAFAVLLLLPAAVAGLVLLARIELGRPIPSWRTRRAGLVALGIAAVAWWLVRDLAFPQLQV
ncbi:DUF2752 domain-containing protein [Kutzneria sp. CA-103260]|uniref:DUF2752 domain-containing protein n=1 Tax=Kutzneria sp. CA-103260 TaxID=2802641 RepID=UPI001BA4980B|nr:DUF2752 domain-containing protein [Kutzneria sp. CA-103260]QUQ67993.1 hypothetical protein JJ691_57330 [Kutzneria sp. CA-103260]